MTHALLKKPSFLSAGLPSPRIRTSIPHRRIVLTGRRQIRSRSLGMRTGGSRPPHKLHSALWSRTAGRSSDLSIHEDKNVSTAYRTVAGAQDCGPAQRPHLPPKVQAVTFNAVGKKTSRSISPFLVYLIILDAPHLHCTRTIISVCIARDIAREGQTEPTRLRHPYRCKGHQEMFPRACLVTGSQ